MANEKRIWLTWEHQPRNISMSRELGCTLFQLESDKSRLGRYMELTRRTLRVLRSEKPDLVFAQNPSIVLSLLVVLLKRFFGYFCVIDEHNAGLFPAEGQSKVLSFLANFILKQADLVIVTNQELKQYCENKHASASICPDPLPNMDLEQSDFENTLVRSDAFQIMVVCSWADDEPYLEVIDAARRLLKLNADIEFLVTGKPKDKLEGIELPENFKLTGYLSNDTYKSTMQNCDAAMVLTLRDNCMNCGAYEAVSAETPGILSNKSILKSYFHTGFRFTENDGESIAQTVLSLRNDRDELRACISEMKRKLIALDAQNIGQLNDDISRKRQGN